MPTEIHSSRVQKFLIAWAVFILMLILPLQVRATPPQVEELETQIVEVVPPDRPGETTLILLSYDGLVLRVRPSDGEVGTLSLLKTEAGSDQYYRIRFRDWGDYDEIESIKKIQPPPLPPAPDREDEPLPPDETHPTYNVSEFFQWLRRKNLRKGAQCYQRAYIWAYDAWRQRGISTNKIFLFFTAKYIREYNYHWWFHVTPYVDTDHGLRTLDPTYTRGPLPERSWTNVFVRSHTYCPTVERYTGYSNHYRDRYCYMRKVSMYYYHPNRVQRADTQGYVITNWDRSGLRDAQVARPRAEARVAP